MPRVLDVQRINTLSINMIIEDYLKELKDSLQDIHRSFSAFVEDKEILSNISKGSTQQQLTFLNAQNEIKKTNAETGNNLLKAALGVFSRGSLVFLYHALEQLKKECYDLCSGSDFTYDRILKCVRSLDSFFEGSQKSSGVLGGDFDFLAQSIQTIGQALTSDYNESSKKTLASIVTLLQEITETMSNKTTVVYAIRSQFIKAVALKMVIEANKKGVDFHQKFDEETFYTKIKAINELSQGLDFLEKNALNFKEILFSCYLEYQSAAEFSKEIDALNPAIKRSRYLRQGLAVETRLAAGFCLGGVRYWGGKSVTLQVEKPFAKHHELNAFEVNPEIIKLQQRLIRNQKPNKADGYVEYLAKTVKMIDAEEDLYADTAFISKVNIGLEGLIDDVLMLAKNYHYEATIIVIFEGPRDDGHAVGFKVIERGEQLFALFFDYNAGEFFTDDLGALKDWIKAYCLKLGYSRSYFQYNLNIMMPEKPLLSSLLREAFSVLNVKKENHLGQSSNALLLAYNALQQSTTMTEMHDESIRSQINELLPFILAEEESVGVALEIIKLHQTIIEKNAEDYGNVFFCSISTMDDTNDAVIALEFLNMARKMVDHLIKIDNSNESLQIALLVKEFIYDVQYAQKIWTPEKELKLEVFFNKVSLLTEVNVVLAENLTNFKEVVKDFEKAIKESKHSDREEIIREKIIIIDSFIMNHWYLWVSKPMLQIFTKIMESDVVSTEISPSF